MSSISTAGNAGKSSMRVQFPSPLADDYTTVARIAYISSDVIISVQPALGVDSDFSHHLHLLASRKAPGIISKEPEAGQPPFIGLQS